MRLFDGPSALFDDSPGGAGGGSGASAPVSAPSTPSTASSAPSAPSAPTAAPPSSGVDTDSSSSAFDNLLNSTLAGPSPTAAPNTPKTSEEKPAEVTPPLADKPVAVEPLAEPEPEADQADDLNEDDSDLDSAMEDAAKPNLLDLKASRGKRIYGAYKAYKAITEALGHEPSVEDVRAHFEAFSDKASMEDEFLSGDPVKAANFASHWNDLNPQAMEKVVATLPDLLVAKNNQNAYVAMAMPVLSRFTNALYQQAQVEQNPDLKKALMYTARMVDWRLRGEYRNDAALQAAPVANPLDAREAQVNQRFSQIQQYEQQQQNAAAQQWTNTVVATTNSALEAATDNALKSLKAALPARVYTATRNDFTEAVKQHLAKDADALRLYNIQFGRTPRSQEGLDQLTNSYMQRASRAIRQLAPALLKEAGVAAVTQNQQTHTALAAQAAAGQAPNSAGRPAPQSIAPNPKQYASKGEQFDDMLAGLLGSGRK